MLLPDRRVTPPRIAQRAQRVHRCSPILLAGRDGMVRPIFAPVTAASVAAAGGRSDGVLVFEGENISKGYAIDTDFVVWKTNTDTEIAELKRSGAELKRRVDAAERRVCVICTTNPPNFRITCGHIFCETCAQRFSGGEGCPFRCTLNGGGPFTPPRRTFNC